ncbi:cephalotocin receptor 1 [Elysia marginata]|uniref:Cephalotocin receptor 1 n=1 Tax=Elysia marginata TaxID=1093978 RepID=A0AAV4JCA6_9GAST|nr:cephalotocin receptor 1 [Elysia marginata]
MNNNTTSGGTMSHSLLLQSLNQENAQLLAPVIAYTLFLMFLGTVGNPVAIYIYGWKWHNTTSRVFLFFLAWMDLINCLVTIPTEIYVMLNLYYFPNGDLCRMSRFVTYCINNTTSAVFLAVAVDRYIRICHPHHRAISIRGAKVACFISLCVGAGVSWPALVLYGRKNIPLVVLRPVDGNYVFGAICAVKNEFDDTPYPLAFFIYLCVAVCACSLILTSLYIPIGKVMLQRRRANKRRKQKRREMEEMAVQGSVALLQHRQNNNTDSGEAAENGRAEGNNGDGCRDMCPAYHQNNLAAPDVNGEVSVGLVSSPPSAVEDNQSSETPQCLKAIHSARNSIRNGRIRPPKSTLMLFAITAVFVCSFLPFLVIMIIREHRGPMFYPSLSPVEQILVNIFSRSYLVNNCTNPIVYGMCNSQFRYQVRRLFRMSSHRRDSSLSRGESRPPAAEGVCASAYTNTTGHRFVDPAVRPAASSDGASPCCVAGGDASSGSSGYNADDDAPLSCALGLSAGEGGEDANPLLEKSQNGLEGSPGVTKKAVALSDLRDKDMIVLHDLPYCGPTSDL